MDKSAAVKQIDAALKRFGELETKYKGSESGIANATGIELGEVIALLKTTLDRLAPPGSSYGDELKKFPQDKHGYEVEISETLCGILLALRADYQADRLQTIRQLIHADLFSDFLEMAEYFLEETYKDPAAMIAGGVLEQHLRKLCSNYGIATTEPVSGRHRKLDAINADLAKHNAYARNNQKQITAWADIRNDAAHGNYGNYNLQQVKLMTAGIRDFMSRNPA